MGSTRFRAAVHQLGQLRAARSRFWRRRHVRRRERQHNDHAATLLSHPGPANVLQLSDEHCRGRHDARDERHVCRWRATAHHAAGVLLPRTLRRARRICNGVAGRNARDPTAGTRSASLDNTAWQVQFAWFLTGEDEAFRGFTPATTFSLDNHTWGAFELVARYHELDIDDDAFTGGANSFANPATAASKASAWGVGINWYLNQNYKWSINYDVTSFDGGAATGDRPDEEALFTRFALQF